MSNRVYIGRLSSRASERDIEHFFRGYGRLRDIILKNGFGFVVSSFLPTIPFSRLPSNSERIPTYYTCSNVHLSRSLTLLAMPTMPSTI